MVIELDLSAPWEPPDAAEPAATVPSWLVFVVALLVFLGTVAAADPPPASAQALSVQTGARDLRLGGGLGFLLARDGASTGELTAVDPNRPDAGDGTGVIWRRRIPAQVGPWVTDGRYVAYTRYANGGPGIGQVPSVEMLDARTGEVRWTSPGRGVLALVPGVLAVYQTVPAPGPPAGVERRVYGLHVDTGATLWQYTSPRGAIWAAQSAAAQPVGIQVSTSATGPSRVVELTVDGYVRTVDLRTGSASTPVRVDRPGTTLWVVAEGQTLMIRDGAGGDGLRGYDLATGAVRWHNRVRSFLQICGDYLCGEVGGTLSVLDTAGTVRWRADFGGQSIVVGQRLLAPAGGAYGIPGTSLIDLPTGKVLRSYGRWQVITAPDRDGRAVAVVNEPTRLTVGVLGVDTGHTVIVGSVSPWIGQAACVADSRYVACTSGTRLVVWRLDRAQARLGRPA